MNKAMFLALILVAVLLVAAALIFVSFNPIEHRFSETDVDVLTQQITRGEDHVAVEELADRIIKGQGDYMLIDLRSKDRYDERHIDTAVHIPLTELVKHETHNTLPGDRSVIVYGSDISKAAQAVVILRLEGVPAYYLEGGYQRWTAYMTDPAAAGIDQQDASQLAKYDAIRCYLEGDYVADAGLVVKQPAGAAAFTPPLTPVKQAPPAADPLGLGLGLGLPPATAPTESAAAAPMADPLGLGLGLGDAAAPVSQPAADAGLGLGGGAPAGLKIGEGC